MTDSEVRARHVADQTNARTGAALDALLVAIRGTDREAIDQAVVEYGKASWEAGWDQAHADIRAIVKDVSGIDIGTGAGA